MLVEIRQHPLDDAYWANKRPDLASIHAPALVCASWSDQGLHTRGSLEGFRRISSEHKWLYTHGRGKWETYYSPEAQTLQRRFFDSFLKDIDNGMKGVPRVRLEVRRALTTQDVRGAVDWPLPGATTRRLYLDATSGLLTVTPAHQESSVIYSTSRTGGAEKRAIFAMRFDYDTEITGGMRLRLWIAAKEADDADLFVGVEKLSPTGALIGFSGYQGVPNDVAAKGWLRVSHREADEARSTETQPLHPYRRLLKVAPGEVVAADVEIWSSSTLFEAGSTLRLVVQGREVRDYPAFGHTDTVNRGRYRLFTGGRYDASLSMPVVPCEPVQSEA